LDLWLDVGQAIVPAGALFSAPKPACSHDWAPHQDGISTNVTASPSSLEMPPSCRSRT